MPTEKATQGPYSVYEVCDDEGNVIARGMTGADGIGLNQSDEYGCEKFPEPTARLLAASWGLREACKAVLERRHSVPFALTAKIEAALALSEPEVEADE